VISGLVVRSGVGSWSSIPSLLVRGLFVESEDVSPTLSAIALQSALAGWTDEIWLECITFDHASLAEPIRLVNDKVDLERTAGTFIAFPFQFQDFVRGDGQSVEAQISADNVDQRILSALRGIVGKPTVTYEVVLHGTPNTIERGPMEFEVLGFSTNLTTVSLRVSFALSFLDSAFPKDWVAPWNAAT
jgi:hypothetical protein